MSTSTSSRSRSPIVLAITSLTFAVVGGIWWFIPAFAVAAAPVAIAWHLGNAPDSEGRHRAGVAVRR
ncbi:hypothetical protein ACU61A_09420 [Pseudonocardia sichuanensis]